MTTGMTRRAALTGTAGAGIAGLLGAAWTTTASGASAAPVPSTAPRALSTAAPVATGGRRGRRATGDAVAHLLALYDPGGADAGELVVTGTVLAVRGRATDTAAVHHHLLRLPGGTLAGHGTLDHSGRGEFVVVGGTGRFHGASGAYRVEPGPGGGSTLTFHLDPARQEA